LIGDVSNAIEITTNTKTNIFIRQFVKTSPASAQCYKLLYDPNFARVHDLLQCLSLARFSSLA
jgi:hypothetical protein